MSQTYDDLISHYLNHSGKETSFDGYTKLCEALDAQRRPELLRVAGQMIETANLTEPRLRGKYYMARALANSGQQEQAWDLFIETLDAAKEEVGALTVYIDCLASLSAITLKLGDIDQSMGLATEAFSLAQESNYTKGIAATCNHFGSLKLQQGNIDGALEYLEEALKHASRQKSQSVSYPIYSNLGIAYMLQGNFALALEHFTRALQDSRQVGHHLGEALTGINIANLYNGQGNFPKALEYVLQSLKTYEALDDKQNISYALGLLGDIYKDLQHYTEAAKYYRKALDLRQKIDDIFGQATSYHHLGSVLALQGTYDEAAEHLLHAREICEDQGYNVLLAMVYLELGGLYILQKRHQDAWEALQTGRQLADAAGHKHLHNRFLQYSGKLEVSKQLPHEALPLLLQGEALAQELGLEDDLRKICLLISECYEQMGETEQALTYYKRFYQKDKKLHGEENARFIISLELGHQLEQKTKEAEIARLRNIELKKAYDELTTAQERLVQQEKLASLGRLVTGIAHELQNPLNFVTNFSALSLDLVDELAEITDEEERAEVTNDVKENLSKINAHGKRASTIVKSMLELKRDGTGTPQPIALGRVVDEFVPLAWNSYRSRYPDLHVQINVAPYENDIAARIITMDVGRAIISIMHNAFDALKESKEKHGTFFTPVVNVSLGKANGHALIVIEDNGSGIAQEHIGLVFEPFYTTKPTGSGNIGLGLSMAHDMIVAQGGTIKVDSTANFGAIFTISLPLAAAEDLS